MKNEGTQAIKRKPCKLCLKPRWPKFQSTSWCYFHYLEQQRKNKQEKAAKKLARKIKTKTYQRSEWKKWHAKTWVLMSELVRRKDAGFAGYNECFTCERSFPWQELHCGHFQHGKLDFDERNLKPQCPSCNTYHAGRLDVYAAKLVKMHGLEWVESLIDEAHKHSGYSLNEIKETYSHIKLVVDMIRKSKG